MRLHMNDLTLEESVAMQEIQDRLLKEGKLGVGINGQQPIQGEMVVKDTKETVIMLLEDLSNSERTAVDLMIKRVEAFEAEKKARKAARDPTDIPMGDGEDEDDQTAEAKPSPAATKTASVGTGHKPVPDRLRATPILKAALGKDARLKATAGPAKRSGSVVGPGVGKGGQDKPTAPTFKMPPPSKDPTLPPDDGPQPPMLADDQPEPPALPEGSMEPVEEVPAEFDPDKPPIPPPAPKPGAEPKAEDKEETMPPPLPLARPNAQPVAVEVEDDEDDPITKAHFNQQEDPVDPQATTQPSGSRWKLVAAIGLVIVVLLGLFALGGTAVTAAGGGSLVYFLSGSEAPTVAEATPPVSATDAEVEAMVDAEAAAEPAKSSVAAKAAPAQLTPLEPPLVTNNEVIEPGRDGLGDTPATRKDPPPPVKPAVVAAKPPEPKAAAEHIPPVSFASMRVMGSYPHDNGMCAAVQISKEAATAAGRENLRVCGATVTVKQGVVKVGDTTITPAHLMEGLNGQKGDAIQTFKVLGAADVSCWGTAPACTPKK